MDEAKIWRERYFALLRWVEQQQPESIPKAKIEEGTEADWNDFWYNEDKDGI